MKNKELIMNAMISLLAGFLTVGVVIGPPFLMAWLFSDGNQWYDIPTVFAIAAAWAMTIRILIRVQPTDDGKW